MLGDLHKTNKFNFLLPKNSDTSTNRNSFYYKSSVHFWEYFSIFLTNYVCMSMISSQLDNLKKKRGSMYKSATVTDYHLTF